jgi:hypothetical protein
MPDAPGHDLWIRASRVRECCNIALEVTAHPPGWEVVIEQRGKDPSIRVGATGEHLSDALSAAIAKAEKLGLTARP